MAAKQDPKKNVNKSGANKPAAETAARTPYDIVCLSRDKHRPTAVRYIRETVEGFIELHGDRGFADDAAVIGGGSLIHQFCHIGRNIMLQGGALVNKDIPPFVKAAREPISYVGINSVGLHRNHFTDEEIRIINDVYRILYLSDLNITNAVKLVRDTCAASPLRDEIIDFIEHSERGVIRSAI